jgi:hypothetical protein
MNCQSDLQAYPTNAACATLLRNTGLARNTLTEIEFVCTPRRAATNLRGLLSPRSESSWVEKDVGKRRQEFSRSEGRLQPCIQVHESKPFIGLGNVVTDTTTSRHLLLHIFTEGVYATKNRRRKEHTSPWISMISFFFRNKHLSSRNKIPLAFIEGIHDNDFTFHFDPIDSQVASHCSPAPIISRFW